jgi:hypothetical protein
MIKEFRGYIPYTDEEKKEIWKNGTFVFDTNILLNLYRYSISTRDQFLEILEKIKDNIWIPNQVAKEYFRNRCTVLYNQHQLYKEIRDKAQFSPMKELLNKNKDRHSSIDCKKLLKIVETAEKNILKVLEKNEDEEGETKYDNDEICNKLLKLFENKCGAEYPTDKLKALYDEGKMRFEEKLPPGYKDSKKVGNEKYGDLILWKQIMDYAEVEKKSIIFITDDRKEDWLQRLPDNSIIGARQELRQEISRKTGVDCLIYRPQQFLEIAASTYGLADSELGNSLNEVEKFDKADTVDMSTINPYTQRITEIMQNAIMPTQGINEITATYVQRMNEIMATAVLPAQRMHEIIATGVQNYNKNLTKALITHTANKLYNLTIPLEEQKEKIEK